MLLSLGVSVNPDDFMKREISFTKSMEIRLKADVDVVNLDLILLKNDELEFNNFNYAHIPALKRYYFITNIEVLGSNRYKLSLSCDVLYTYMAEILLCKGLVMRQIKTGDYFQGQVDSSALKTITKQDTGVSLPDDQILILSTVGGE